MKSLTSFFALSVSVKSAIAGKYHSQFGYKKQHSEPTVTYNNDSVCFQLMPYSCDNAHRTIRIETQQRGYFEGGFDYTGLTVAGTTSGGLTEVQQVDFWSQQIRLWGKFVREGRDLNIDNIVTEERGQEMVQTQTIKRYSLKLDTIQTSISNPLIDDMLLAPNVKISDYNINNIEVYRNERVSLTDLGDPIITPLNINEFYEIKFAEWKQNNIHRFR